MESIIVILVLLALIALFIVKVVFKTRCFKCREKYSPDKMVIVADELKWERREKKETKSVNAMHVNSPEYIEITKYKVYYRIVTFAFECPKCGKMRYRSKKYELYDGSSRHSTTVGEMDALLRRKIERTLGRKFLDGRQIKIKNIDY